ncbi:MAG: cytochrome c oxidase assembly protein [Acidobacteriota bacterium]
MSDASASVFAEWSMPPVLTTIIILTGLIYLRGWFAVRRTRQAQIAWHRAACFLGGLMALWLAIASPLDGFADLLLSAHMVQHLLLMSVVPPLLLLGWPAVPLLRGLPAFAVPRALLRSTQSRRVGHWVVSPLVAWVSMNAVLLGWHVPAAYDFALENEHWHEFEHICFLASSLAFWWCVVNPWPGQKLRDRWELLLYLLSADLVNTGLSAYLAFCDRPVYLYYLVHSNPWRVPPLADQVLGAVIMWVVGSFVFLLPAAQITFRLLQTSSDRVR